MSKHPQPLRIGIIGGGIAGVALALDLSRHAHLQVQLFESAGAFGEVGAGVSIGANAVRAINGLGLGDAYRQLADSTPAPWQDVWFEWRRGMDAGYLSASLAPGVGQSSVHRADFLDVLASRLPAGLARFGKRAHQVSQHDNEVQVLFSDGSAYRCDLLIGADGIKSTLRSHVLAGLGAPDSPPRFSGTCAYRGMIDSQQLRHAYRAAGIDEHLIDVPQMYLGRDAHILTFPVKHGRLINVVAFISDRHQAEPCWPEGMPWVREASQAEMLAAFAGWAPAVQVLLGCIPKPSLWALHELAELPGYVHGRVALIGDAAHAMLPHQGAGAGQGLEDALFLARLLGDPAITHQALDALLASYDALRRPRATWVQRTSRAAGELYELRDPLIGAEEQALGQRLAHYFDALWNHDLEQDIALARQQLGWHTPLDSCA